MEYKSLLNESELDLRDIVLGGSSDGILKVVSSTVGVYTLSGQFSTIGDTISVINLNGLNTGMLVEGSNLYYTNARSRAAISAGLGILYNSSTGVISLPQAVDLTSTVQFGALGLGVAPSYALHIKNSSNPQLVIDSNAGATSEMRHYVAGVLTSTFFATATSLNLRSVTSIPLNLGAGNTNYMTILSSGLVSVGGTISDTVSRFEVIDINNLGITINAPTPRYNMYESDAASNEKWWDQLAISGALSFRAVNDAQSAASSWMTVDRTGIAIDAISFPNGNVGIGVYPGYLLHLAGSQTNTINMYMNSTTTSPVANADMYGLIHYGRLNYVSGATNFGTGQYLALTMNVPTSTTVVNATSVVCVQPTNSGAGSVTNARTLQVAAPAVGTACNIATWTENLSVGSGYFSNTPPTYGAIIQGSVGIGCTSFHNALQVATGGATDTGTYGKAIQTVRPAASALHLAFVRQSSWVWGLGFLYNTNTFAIYNSPSGTDSSNTAPAFSIDTFNTAYFAGSVGINTNNPQDKLDMSSGAIRFYNGTDYQRLYAGQWGLYLTTNRLSGSLMRMGEYNGNLGIWTGDGATGYNFALGTPSGKDIYICPANITSVYCMSTSNIGMGGAPTSTGGYFTRLDIQNGGVGPSIKVQDSTGSGRGHIQFGSHATATNNVHIGCEGNGAFYVWNGTFGTGVQKLLLDSSGNLTIAGNLQTGAFQNYVDQAAFAQLYLSGGTSTMFFASPSNAKYTGFDTAGTSQYYTADVTNKYVTNGATAYRGGYARISVTGSLSTSTTGQVQLFLYDSFAGVTISSPFLVSTTTTTQYVPFHVEMVYQFNWKARAEFYVGWVSGGSCTVTLYAPKLTVVRIGS